MQSTPPLSVQQALLVPQQKVKTVKTLLEERKLLDKTRKIAPYSEQDDSSAKSAASAVTHSRQFIVPILTESIGRPSGLSRAALDNSSSLEGLISLLRSQLESSEYSELCIINDPRESQSPSSSASTTRVHRQTNPLRSAFSSALESLEPQTLEQLGLSPSQLLDGMPSTYSIYPPMLLLPAHTFQSASWAHLFSHHAPSSDLAQRIFSYAAQRLGVTHIATNAPIALHNNPSDPSSAPTSATEQRTTTTNQAVENILRSPTALTPLHGSFGVPLPPYPAHAPTARDFAQALWVSARQNGIVQTWAPLYTMFSRGNVKEKARVLALPSVAAAVRDGGESESESEGGGGGGCAAVDLYAGIGYFAFSYRRAGVRKVLGWELNPWSVEGLRRGAEANGWAAVVWDEEAGRSSSGVEGADGKEVQVADEDFLVFRESNERAGARIEGLRASVPSVRHVNCGLLPTSRGSWETAVRAVDPRRGGWVHLHENFGEREIDARAAQVVGEVGKIWERVRAERRGGGGGGATGAEESTWVRLEHVERVKTYAPGVMHCVLDVWIPPSDR